ncbi:MAG: hypothetical protein U5K29_06180 [Acidimicrobiales bacterium]|nr:hypothetical protein [Acidimicrobiales bacterium]
MGLHRHRRSTIVATVRIALLVALLLTGLMAEPGPALAQSDESGDATSTSVVERDGQSPAGDILPQPNSGEAPDSPGDPGGWQQYLVFGLIFAGLAAIVALVVRESRQARSPDARQNPTAGPEG